MGSRRGEEKRRKTLSCNWSLGKNYKESILLISKMLLLFFVFKECFYQSILLLDLTIPRLFKGISQYSSTGPNSTNVECDKK